MNIIQIAAITADLDDGPSNLLLELDVAPGRMCQRMLSGADHVDVTALEAHGFVAKDADTGQWALTLSGVVAAEAIALDYC